jgi:hypothetical protein
MEINVLPETERRLTEMATQIGARVADYAGFLLDQKVRESDDETFANGANENSEDLDINPNALAEARQKLLNRTPEEKEEARVRLLQRSRRARPLPEGKTFVDVVCGQWPGDETEEQILEALRKLS